MYPDPLNALSAFCMVVVMQDKFSVTPSFTFNFAASSCAVIPRVESIVSELLKMFCASAFESTMMIVGGWHTVDVELI